MGFDQQACKIAKRVTLHKQICADYDPRHDNDTHAQAKQPFQFELLITNLPVSAAGP